MIVFFVILIFIALKLFKPTHKVGKTSIEIVMGKTGIGKSTFLCLKARDYLKKGYNVYSNVSIAGTKQFIRSDLGKNLMEDGLLIFDEAGLDFNARDFKKFTNELYGFFTLHRHYRLHIILSVQFWDRLDIVIRELIHRIYVLKPNILIKTYIKCKQIDNDIDIVEGEIKQTFFWVPFWMGGTKYYLRRPAYPMFDTHSREKLNDKNFDYWSEYDEVPLYKLYVNDIKKIGNQCLSTIKYVISAYVKIVLCLIVRKIGEWIVCALNACITIKKRFV